MVIVRQLQGRFGEDGDAFRFRRLTPTATNAFPLRKWRHSDSGLQVVEPQHKWRALPIGTLHNILINAEIPEHKWQT